MATSVDVLCVAAHPDDAELGAAGAILKLRAAGKRVGILDLTNGEPTPHGSVEIRSRETDSASELLQIDWRDNLGLTNRELQPTLNARRQLAEVFRQLRPRWIMAPYWEDAHPDHIAATELIEAARFWSKLTKTDMQSEPWYPERIFYYYSVHLRQHPDPSFVLDISDQWETKAAAIACYQSQFVQGREDQCPSLLDQFRDEAAYWGKLISTEYGEPWTTRETLGLNDLSSLI